MRTAPSRLALPALLALLLLPASGSAQFGAPDLSGYVDGMMSVDAPKRVDVCQPDPTCRRKCLQASRRILRRCLMAGHPREECRERKREFLASCLDSECRPTLGCEERCKAHGKRLLWKCLEQGGEPEQCRADAWKATEACIERNCRDCVCPDVYDPVCGVDGMTYGNACEANCAGVRIAYEGACEPMCRPLPCDVFCEYGHVLDADGCPTCECNPPPGCKSDADCQEGEFCREICPLRPCILGDPDCGECVGVCFPEPEPCLCPQIWDPVCGADGVTYSNACHADCAGVRIVHPGECDGGGCTDLTTCDLYCPSGFEVDVQGCPTCRCNPISLEEPMSQEVFGSP